MRRFTLAIILIAFAYPLLADVQTENSQLARINSVLNAVFPLIDAAEKAAPKHRRITFHYEWLRKDVQSIQAGIAQQINQGPLEPRVIQPLTTDYIQLTDKQVSNP